MLRNYTELTNYIDIPDMPLDNNDTERLIRDIVMGKKAYLFCRDLDACKRAAMMYSLFGACKVLDKNPGIIRYRERLGGFYSVDQLAEVPQVTESNFERIVKQIYMQRFPVQRFFSPDPFYPE